MPVPRRPSVDLLKLPFRVIRAVRQARGVLGRGRPHRFRRLRLAPAYLAARSLGIPFFVHEANARAGLANKLGQRLGGTSYNAVPDSGMPGEVVGIPVRASLRNADHADAAARARETWGLGTRKTLLITGGSQGAVSLNKAVAGAVATLTEEFQVLHAYGKRNTAPAPHEHYVALPYIDDMAAAYAVADLIVCRSGAMTVAEVTASGLPAVYVPLPHGTGEQALNATSVVDAGAARLVPDSELTSDRLVSEVTAILGDDEQLATMRAAARDHAAGDAAALLADAVAAALQ